MRYVVFFVLYPILFSCVSHKKISGSQSQYYSSDGDFSLFLEDSTFVYQMTGHMPDVLCKGSFAIKSSEIVFMTDSNKEEVSAANQLQFCKSIEVGFLKHDTIIFKGSTFIKKGSVSD